MISLRIINNIGDKCMRRMVVMNRKEKDGRERDNIDERILYIR